MKTIGNTPMYKQGSGMSCLAAGLAAIGLLMSVQVVAAPIKSTPQQCTREMLNSPQAAACMRQQDADTKAGKKRITHLSCDSNGGMQCCKSISDQAWVCTAVRTSNPHRQGTFNRANAGVQAGKPGNSRTGVMTPAAPAVK